MISGKELAMFVSSKVSISMLATYVWGGSWLPDEIFGVIEEEV